MIRTKIPIQRTPDGLWKAGPCSILIDSVRQIPLSAGHQEDTLEDLVETVMGQALLSLDKNGRRGTSEPIQWEITVEGVPYCYRCVQPMRQTPSPSEASDASERTEWKCEACGAVIELNDSRKVL
jgi:hypothetical protein